MAWNRSKVGKKWAFWGPTVGEHGSKSTSYTLWTQFRTLTKTHFKPPILRVVENVWGSPKASHPHFPHCPRFRGRIFRIFRVFRVFALRNLLRPLFSWGERDFPHFPHFPRFLRIGFESLISKIRPTGFRMTGLRWPGMFSEKGPEAARAQHPVKPYYHPDEDTCANMGVVAWNSMQPYAPPGHYNKTNYKHALICN